jgi:membrane protein YdbS with pleckstrin-like domain
LTHPVLTIAPLMMLRARQIFEWSVAGPSWVPAAVAALALTSVVLLMVIEPRLVRQFSWAATQRVAVVRGSVHCRHRILGLTVPPCDYGV